jgi:cob(I)alamin adenosyltransferase
VVWLAASAEVDPQVLVYLNRLSDLLFVAARVANLRAGQTEIHWESKGAKGVGP